VGGGWRSRMMGMAAEHDRLSLAGPGASEIGNCVLRAHGRGCGAEECQRQYETSHRFSPGLMRSRYPPTVMIPLFDARLSATAVAALTAVAARPARRGSAA